MTGKRFTSQRTEDYNFSDILDNGKWIGICHVDCEDDFVNKFNELSEENEQLKGSVRSWSTSYNRVYEENEQLKQQIKELKIMQSLYAAMNEENQQLKLQLQKEQRRTTPITLNTHISDEDFKKIELMLEKYFGDLE